MNRLDPATLSLLGTSVIEASAGTGKTYTITTLVLRLLAEHGLSIEEILVVTYTRAATAELRDRIRARLRTALECARGESVDDPFVSALVARARAANGTDALRHTLENALFDVDQAPVLTIHGFCQRVLTEHAFESGSSLDTKLTAHTGPLIDEICDDYYVARLHDAPLSAVSALDPREPLKLRSLALRSGHDGSLRVIPEHEGDESFELRAWRAAHATCSRLWREERSLIVGLVRGLPHNRSNADGWAERWDDYLARAEPGIAKKFETAFRRFRKAGVEERTKGKAQVSHAFFEAAEALAEHEQRYLDARRALTLGFRRTFVGHVRRELTRRTEREGIRTFDALLTELDGALSSANAQALLAGLRARYRAALVDEFQDTDPLQYRIFRRIFGEHGAPLLLIGDPKQAIYGFRGADVFAYMAARAEASDRVFTLDTNRRSDGELIAALNGLYASVAQPFALEGIDYHPVLAEASASGRFVPRDDDAPVCVLVLERGGAELRKQIAGRMACEIAVLLRTGAELARKGRHDTRRVRVAPRDVAVLSRTNREAVLVQQALAALGIPSVFQGDQSVFETDDALDVERVLMALAHPGDASAVRSFLCSPYAAMSAEQLSALEHDDAGWDSHRATLSSLHELFLAQGFMQAFRGLLVAYRVEQNLLARPGGTRRITNLWHLGELLSEAALEQRLGPLGLLRWLRLVRADESLRSELAADAHELRLESSEDAVMLTTVHKSKGLEYPIVFLPYAWDAKLLRGDDELFVRFHDPAAHGAPTLDLGSDELEDHKELARGEALSEALRLLYVGLTRAKHRVYVAMPCAKDLPKSALGYTLLGGRESSDELSEAARTEAGALCAELAGRFDPALVRVRLAKPLEAAPAWPTKEPPPLHIRRQKRALDDRHRTSSFSALTSGARGTMSEAGVDHDALDVSEDELSRTPELALDTFPRGAAAGQLVHEVLEHADFCGSHDALRAIVEQTLARHRYPASLAQSLTDGLARMLETELAKRGEGDAALSLSRIAHNARLNELEFLLPVASSLTVPKLERVFRAHARAEALRSYAQQVRGLHFEALTGFLRGFIDLVFVHEGRFFVVDYKSNRLGARAEDYRQEALERAMAEHHYYLQYHLYCVAVHRYLKQRIASYDYDAHFGGVYYLFLRGMAPDHAPMTGVFFDRPSRALIDGLDAMLDAEGATR